MNEGMVKCSDCGKMVPRDNFGLSQFDESMNHHFHCKECCELMPAEETLKWVRMVRSLPQRVQDKFLELIRKETERLESEKDD